MTVLHILNIIDTQLISLYIWTAMFATHTCVLGVFLLALYQPEWETIFVETIACGRSICIFAFLFASSRFVTKQRTSWILKLLASYWSLIHWHDAKYFVYSVTPSRIQRNRWKKIWIQLAWTAKYCGFFFQFSSEHLAFAFFSSPISTKANISIFKIFCYNSKRLLSLNTQIRTLNPYSCSYFIPITRIEHL